MKSEVFAVLVAFAGLTFAQPAAVFHQRLGGCTAQTDKAKRALCFESLARDALNQLDATQTPNACPAAPACSVLEQPQKAEAPPSSASRYAQDVTKAKELLVRSFKDPASVQWRNTFVSERHSVALCGELNAKNSYGGYIGFQRFLSVPAQDLFLIYDEKSASVPGVFQGQWDIFCANEIARVE